MTKTTLSEYQFVGSDLRLIGAQRRSRAFLAAPYGAEFSSLVEVLEVVLNSSGFEVCRLTRRRDKKKVVPEILQLIRNADIVVALLTASRPNVFFELGVALGQAIPSIIIARSPDDLGMMSGQNDLILYGDQPELVGKLLRDKIAALSSGMAISKSRDL